jgi:hypothetical protein
MKIQANTIEEFFKASGEKESDLRELDQFIMDTIPELQRGFKTIPSISMIGYWPADMTKDEWPIVALAPQKHYISLYVIGVKEGKSLSEYYTNKLGKTSNGKGCIRFRKLADVDKIGLQTLIKDAFAV